MLLTCLFINCSTAHLPRMSARAYGSKERIERQKDVYPTLGMSLHTKYASNIQVNQLTKACALGSFELANFSERFKPAKGITRARQLWPDTMHTEPS